MKRFLSVFLCIVIVLSIAFQCSFTSSAVVGIDDALLIATICLDLACLGVTFANASEFFYSDTFQDLLQSVGNDIDHAVSVVKRNGVLFFATAKSAWSQLCSWVKNKFSGKTETKQIEYETSQETNPSTLTLRNGQVVPWAEFMKNPFFIYDLGSGIRAICCNGRNVGMSWATKSVRIWCTGTGTVSRYDLNGGAWQLAWTEEMRYGLSYKGETGSFFDLTFTTYGWDNDNNYLYRTMQRVAEGGTNQEVSPPETVPEVEENVSAYVTATSDAQYYPGAVDSPTEVIQDGEQILIRVPDELLVDANTSNPTITTNVNTIAQTISETTPADVKPQVLTQIASQAGTVDQIIADTPTAELDGTNAGSAENDIETADKFRLPQSFLEGFPFSIPYSVYVGIQSFISDPQAPTFKVPFSIPRLGINEDVEIDLTNWNPVARLCRALLSLVWVAGLAMACGKFIKR